MPKRGFVPAVYGHVRGGRDRADGIERHECVTSAIVGKTQEINNGVRRQMSHTLFEITDRQSAEFVKCHPASKGGLLLSEDVFVQPVERCDPAHHEYLLRVRLRLESRGHSAR